MLLRVSAKFNNAPVSQVVSSLTMGRAIRVSIRDTPSGRDSSKAISVTFVNIPLQLALREVEKLAGVKLDAPWLPQVSADTRISVCIRNQRASAIADLLSVVSGQRIELPNRFGETPVSLKLRDVTVEEAIRELLSATK